jgi:ferrous iron transport protein B
MKAGRNNDKGGRAPRMAKTAWVSDHASYVALAGNPNSGKTSVFNALTGGRAKTANYAGVTVEKREGRFKTAGGRDVRILDLPGLYSLSTGSPEEQIAQQVLLGLRDDTPKPDAAVVVVDASNLERNLYLACQVAETGLPVIIVLNMMDVAQGRGTEINVRELSHELGMPVIETVATTGKGIDQLKELLDHMHTIGVPPRRWQMAHHVEHVVGEVAQELLEAGAAVRSTADWLARRALFSDGPYQALMTPELEAHIAEHRRQVEASDDDLLDAEVEARYRWLRNICETTVRKPDEERRTRTELVDRLVLHPVAGPVIFALLMAAVFQAVFAWAQWPISMIQAAVSGLGGMVNSAMPAGELRSLLVDGLLGGVGNVLAFLPQIVILFFFIALLEDSGYMARAAFLMDKLMSRVGLNGQAFIPLLSSFACAIPGIMATRTIRERRDRLTTILVAPLMTCSARLPVYTLFIAAFFPEEPVFGVLSSRGLILLGLYLGGIVAALSSAWLLRRSFLRGEKTPLLLEIPSYKLPRARNVGLTLWDSSWEFVKRAGSIILIISVLVWFLASHPTNGVLREKLEAEGIGEAEIASRLVADSYLGRFGKMIEPAMKPLGFDWKISVGLVSSFAAREVIISTLGTIYFAGSAEDAPVTLDEAMHADVYPGTDRPVWTPLTATSLLVFFVFACMCISTLVSILIETRNIGWPLFVVAYTFALAYLASLVVYQGGLALGFG